MRQRAAHALSGFLIAFMFATALWAIDALPPGARVAVHWNANWQADGWSGKWAGLLFIPCLALVLQWALSAVPQGVTMPGKLPLPEHARRALFVCVLFIEAAAQAAIAVNAVLHSVR